MPKTNWQDPQTEEIRSIHIAGLQDAVGKMEEALGLESTSETDINLINVPAYSIGGTLEYRIYQAPAGKRNWLSDPVPTIKKNGTEITAGYNIDYGGGAIVLESSGLESDIFTASFTRTTSHPAINAGNIVEDSTHRFTSDTEKSVWNNKQDLLGYTPENPASKGQANGYAGLGSDGKVPSIQLPSLTPADGSITDTKLSNDPGAIKQVVTAHLAEQATLSTYSHVKINKSASDIVPACTNADVTLYVRTDGDDSHDGSANDAARALKTIQAAINRIPQIVNHAVNITVNTGTYNEDLTINGFVGSGYIYLSYTGGTVSINSITVNGCFLAGLYGVKLNGVTLTSTTRPGLLVTSCGFVSLTNSACTAAASGQDGVAVYYTVYCEIASTTISNRQNGIYASGAALVESYLNGGSGNTTGLHATVGATIGKYSSQPGGTTAELAERGGVIR